MNGQSSQGKSGVVRKGIDGFMPFKYPTIIGSTASSLSVSRMSCIIGDIVTVSSVLDKQPQILSALGAYRPLRDKDNLRLATQMPP